MQVCGWYLGFGVDGLVSPCITKPSTPILFTNHTLALLLACFVCLPFVHIGFLLAPAVESGLVGSVPRGLQSQPEQIALPFWFMIHSPMRLISDDEEEDDERGQFARKYMASNLCNCGKTETNNMVGAQLAWAPYCKLGSICLYGAIWTLKN